MEAIAVIEVLRVVGTIIVGILFFIVLSAFVMRIEGVSDKRESEENEQAKRWTVIMDSQNKDPNYYDAQRTCRNCGKQIKFRVRKGIGYNSVAASVSTVCPECGCDQS